jgi:hypothetical protein
MSVCSHTCLLAGIILLQLVMILLQLILVVLFATTGVFQPPPERPPSGTVRYQLAANNLQGGSTISGNIASQMLLSRPDVPSAAQYRPS